MRWLFGAQRLRERGILGMNRRNAEYILAHNSPASIALVDDKLRVHRLCLGVGVPTPEIFAAVRHTSALRNLTDALARWNDFVIKPARGSGGRGVLVITGQTDGCYRRTNRELLPPAAIMDHLTDVLSGMHSLGGRPDVAMVQQRIGLHPALAPLVADGIPDIRIIVYRGEPAMAMLRLPTRASAGRANLHQGGLGVGIELQSGVTHHAVQSTRNIRRHPDTGAELIGFRVPKWNELLEMSRRVASAVGLGYLGVDIVLDPERGPLLLEANARPGLAIQHANAAGLLSALRAIDGRDFNQSQPFAEQPADLGGASAPQSPQNDVAAA
jgi:alpha-L-glutamate ligase-like protein